MSGYYKNQRDTSEFYSSSLTVKRGSNPPETQPYRDVQYPSAQSTYSFRSGGSSLSDPKNLVSNQDSSFGQDTGHVFDTVRFTTHGGRGKVTRTGFYAPGDETITLNSPILICGDRAAVTGDPLDNFILVPSMTVDTVNQLGASLIKRAIPTRPEASLAQLVGEIKREGLPSLSLVNLYTSAPRNRFQKAGGEYLNVEFGWKPLISDLTKILKAVVNSKEILEQYRRDSGKLVRRRVSLPVEISTNEYEYAPDRGRAALYGAAHVLENTFASRKVQVMDRISTETWFSGAFSYYLDVGDDALSKLTRYEQYANKLLGSRITPSVLYELSPWTWLADWFGNIGDILSNASAFSEDGLVIRYGYLMRRTVATRYLSYTPVSNEFGVSRTLRTSYRTERKERAKATPYGFGINSDALNVRQIAILTALGMTKSPTPRW